MDTLYYKIFRNKFLFTIIYGYVKDGKGKQLKDINVTEILENRFLFNLFYQSYLFNRKNENESNYRFQFRDINILESFFLSNIITIQEFIFIYNDYEKILKGKKNKILKLCILNNKMGKEMIEFLIKYKNYKFDINHFQLYIGKMCKRKEDNLNFILYIVDCFKNHSFNYNCTNRVISNKEKEKQLSNPFTLKFQPLMDCLDYNKVSCYQTIMDLSMDSIVNANSGLDIQYKCKFGDIKTVKNQLIVRMLVLGSMEMAKIYVNKFPNQKSNGENNLFFRDFRDFGKSLQVYEVLLSNKTLSLSHFKFIDYSFLISSPVSIFKNYLENHLGFNLEANTHHNLIAHGIYEVYDLETLKYLEQVKDRFSPPLTFNVSSLLLRASNRRDFKLFKYLVESPFFKVSRDSNISFSNTSLDIIRYCFKTFTRYSFNDIGFECAFDGDLEYVKFIVDKFHSTTTTTTTTATTTSNHNRIQLSYRCIDRVCERNYTNILIYLFDNVPELQISREPINYAIKNQNFEMVQLLIDKIPTKPNDHPTLYESTVTELKNYSKKDNRILSLLLDNQIYNKILFERYGELFI
ncbi:hypothetical protein ACTA71_003122 [Dictyostelium dimigraforme]